MRRLGDVTTGLAVALSAAILCACGHSGPRATARPIATTAAASTSTSRTPTVTATVNDQGNLGRCAIFDRGSGASLGIAAKPTINTENECAALARSLSTGGDFWTMQPQSSADAAQVICVMFNAPYTASVEDSGGGVIGQNVCSSLVSAGWTEDLAAENEEAAAAASAGAQAASASASASALVALANQRSRDEQTEADDIKTLTSDAAFTSDLSSLSNDASQAQSDLATTRNDAQTGGGDQCINASTTVFNDAATTLLNDQVTTMANDLATLGRDIGQAREDIQGLQADAAQSETDGAAANPSLSETISSAEAAIAAAVNGGNTADDEVRADVVAGYSVANSVATGPCAGAGPGSPPAITPHLS